MEGYEKYASRMQELLFDGMDVHEVWVYMKVMFQIEKNEICFRAYLERSGLITLPIWQIMNQQRMPRSGCKEVRTLWRTA